VFGIVDFRLCPDPYIPLADEYEKARRLAEEGQRVSFENLVRFYWDITPGVAGPDVERYVRYALRGEARGGACLEALERHRGQARAEQACLEIGCGTGGFLLAARQRFGLLVGADVALRWLVIAKKRLENVREPIQLAKLRLKPTSNSRTSERSG
jgi:SAM-dependent methyltransferase